MNKKTTTVFTNGCFEILHPGHNYLLKRAKALGDDLIVGLNSDKSFEKLRGRKPFRNQKDREIMLLYSKYVDNVIIFHEKRPDELIKKLEPDIVVKGGDWKGRLKIEEELVKKWGGKVVDIPRHGDYSTTNIINDIQKSCFPENEYMKLHCETIKLLDEKYNIKKIIDVIYDSFKKGNKLLICGNGGSAADAIHLAGEFVCIGLPAIALTENISTVTAIGNDRGYLNIFNGQIQALANKDDIILLLTTSGSSINIISAAKIAKKLKCKTILITGKKIENDLKRNCDIIVNIDSEITEIIQEVYFMINHMIYINNRAWYLRDRDTAIDARAIRERIKNG